MTQPTLFDPPEPVGSLTLADLDEWAAYVAGSGDDHGHWPIEWARDGLARVLGEPVPYRRYTTAELTEMLRRARAAMTGGER